LQQIGVNELFSFEESALQHNKIQKENKRQSKTMKLQRIKRLSSQLQDEIEELKNLIEEYYDKNNDQSEE